MASLTFLGRNAAHHAPESSPAHSLLLLLLSRPAQLDSGWQDLASSPQLLRVRALCQHQALALVAAVTGSAGASKDVVRSAGLWVVQQVDPNREGAGLGGQPASSTHADQLS